MKLNPLRAFIISVCFLILLFTMSTRLGVDFYYNSVSFVEASASSLIIDWDAKGLSKVTAPLVFDQAGHSTTSALDNTKVGSAGTPGSFSITITVHYVMVEIVSPLSGATLFGVVNITTALTDNTAVTKVDFLANDYLISTDTISPYSVSWNTADVPDGIYSLVVVVWDSLKKTSSDSVSVVVDNVGSGVIITSPESGNVVGGILDVTAEASADVVRVEFCYDDKLIASDTTPTLSDTTAYFAISWDTTSVSDGTYSLVAVAYDQVGNTASEAISVLVDNTHPQISISVYTSDSDVIYKNNETINLLIELKQSVLSVSADFSRVDSNGSMVEASLLEDNTYRASYMISNDNTRSDGFYIIPVTVAIFSSFLTEDESFVAVLDNRDIVESATELPVKGAQEDLLIQGPPGSDIILTVSTSDDTTVVIVKYKENPHPEATFPTNVLPNYVDVYISKPEAMQWLIYIEVGYTEEEIASLGLIEKTLALFYWKDGEWRECSDTGVDTVNNIIWANLSQDELTGSPLVPGGNIPPSVHITSPTSGDIVSGIIEITASASDASGIARVEFWYNATFIALDTASSFAVSWDTTALTDGPHSLFAVAYDQTGNSTTSATVSVTVDNIPPTVAIASPKEDAIVSKEINIKGTATDIHFKQYELEYGSGGGSFTFKWIEIVGSTTAVSDDTLGIWDTRIVSDGLHTLRLLAEDEADNTNEVRIKIKVDNNPPVTILTEYPEKIIAANMAKVDVIFAWDGSDPSGITPPENLVYQYKLEGYDGNGLGNWSDWVFEKNKTYALPAGDYVFKVRAKDEVGNYPDEDDEATAKCSFKVSLPVVVYPSPVYPDRGDVVKIANLPLNSTVYIYSIVGELIRALDTPGEVVEEGGSATAIWDCRNDFGEMVARGVYIYYCPKVIGNRKTGKIAIIR